MSETVTKKKKKIDFELLRKLEDEYDDAVEDVERKERVLLDKVYIEYKNEGGTREVFNSLQKSETWYMRKFNEEPEKYPLQFASKSDAMKKVHQERKVQSVVEDLEEMEEEIPILEVDDSLKEGVDYVDPAEEKREWIQKTKEELMSEKPKTITSDSNFGKYQQTKQMLCKARDVSKHDFAVSNNYKKILVHQLKKTIEYYNNLLKEIE